MGAQRGAEQTGEEQQSLELAFGHTACLQAVAERKLCCSSPAVEPFLSSNILSWINTACEQAVARSIGIQMPQQGRPS